MVADARNRVVYPVAAVAAVLTLAATIAYTWQGFWGGEPYYFFDLEFYRTAVIAVTTGTKSMFAAMAYPPFGYLFIWWLPSVPSVLGDQLWTAATLVLIIAVGVLLTARAAEANRQDWRAQPSVFVMKAALVSSLLIISMPMLSQLTCGQVSLLVIALPFADLSGVLPRRFQGVLVGMAAAIKVTPMIFALYYVVTGQRRQALNAVGSFVACTAFGALFFPAQTVEYWTKFSSPGQEVDPLLPYNYGIRSMLARINPDLIQTSWLWAGLGVALMVVTLWRARKVYQRGDAMEAAFIVAAASLVVPPNSLPHYYTWLPLAGLWLVLTGSRRGQAVGVGLIVLYSMAYEWLLLGLNAIDPQWFSLGVSLIGFVPVLIGIFGLPKRRRAEVVLAGEPEPVAV